MIGFDCILTPVLEMKNSIYISLFYNIQTFLFFFVIANGIIVGCNKMAITASLIGFDKGNKDT